MVVMGILAAVAMPKLTGIRRNAAVRSAKQQVGAYLATARSAAIRRGRPTTFHIDGNTIWITSERPGTPIDTVARPIPLDSEYAVTLSAIVNTVRFDARGFPTNLAGRQVFGVAAGGFSDSVCISRGGLVGRCGF